MLLANDRHASGFRSPDHIGRSATAREGDHNVRLVLIQHSLVADRTSDATVRLPVGWLVDHVNTRLFRAPLASQCIRSRSAALDNGKLTCCRFHEIKRPEYGIAVSEVSATTYQHFVSTGHDVRYVLKAFLSAAGAAGPPRPF